MVWHSGCSASVVHPSAVRRQLFPLNDFFSRTTIPISNKLGRYDTWEKGIQMCSKKVTGLFWGPKGGKIRTILINLQNFSSHEPLAIMHLYLTWSILRTRRLTVVQNKSLGSYMVPSQGLTLLHRDI